MAKAKIKKIVITSNEGACPLECSTGGKYFESIVYHFINNGTAEIEYSISADFDFCKRLAIFTSCRDCKDYDEISGACKRKPEIANLKEILSHIISAVRKGTYDIKIEFSDGDSLNYYGKSPCELCGQKDTCTFWKD